MKGWAAFQSRRRAVTPGLPCPAARRDFFEQQAKPLGDRPQPANTQLHTMLAQQPVLRLRRIPGPVV